ncbi:topoisomerase [Streptomyces sp. NPDC059874]|uniref:topoisomerase n=1 Tax=Streptomyces sp. NPDC059874 TaxID=3346983 RepID=UPI00364C7BE7
MYPGSPAEAYVAARGLSAVAAQFGLGYVGSAIPGHERYRNHLAIPYLRPAGGEDGAATVRFRCVDDRCVKDADGIYLFLKGEKERHEGHGKYQTLPGDVPRMFNTSALIRSSPYLVMVEGEFDAMTWELAGVPAVGSPGTGTWRDYWTPAFRGYEVVYLIAEDAAGLTFMDERAAEMPNGRVIQMADDLDSNSTLLTHGADVLRGRIGL